MNLKEYLTCDDKDEITKRLLKLDASIMALHQNGFYVVSFNANEIILYDEELTLNSFKNKIDYLNSGINDSGDKRDILEMCAIGICAYNNFNTFYINDEFLSYLMKNIDSFKKNGQIPVEVYNYYYDVFANGNVDYFNNYLKKITNIDSGKGSSNSYKLTKSTAIGKAFEEKENAYISVLLIPTIIVFIYCLILFFVIFSK